LTDTILFEQVCYFSKLCYDRHLVGAAGGNISVKSYEDDTIIITPSGVSLRDVQKQCLIKVDLQGKKVSGPDEYKPSKESVLHLNVYQTRPEAKAVIHVHPAYATALSVKKENIQPVTASAELKLRKPIPIADYGLPGSGQLAAAIKKVLTEDGDTEAVVLERHGIIAFGPDLEAAFNVAELVEDTAKIQWLSSH
jgi:L-fuculose-phosphate aldolase